MKNNKERSVFAENLHQMAEIMNDVAEKNVVQWKGFKIPGTNQIDAYEPEPRIPAIDRYMRIYMSIHKESNMGDSFEILRFNFFYYLNRRSRPMSSILLQKIPRQKHFYDAF